MNGAVVVGQSGSRHLLSVSLVVSLYPSDNHACAQQVARGVRSRCRVVLLDQ